MGEFLFNFWKTYEAVKKILKLYIFPVGRGRRLLPGSGGWISPRFSEGGVSRVNSNSKIARQIGETINVYCKKT